VSLEANGLVAHLEREAEASAISIVASSQSGADRREDEQEGEEEEEEEVDLGEETEDDVCIPGIICYHCLILL
jgi:hypothetical protein